MKNSPLLEVRKISKSFGGLQALKDVDFVLFQGESLGIIGPNGAGKTTLFNIIAGYFPPDNGNIIFKGEDITGLRAYKVARKGISRTFQNLQIFPEMSVLENVMTGRHHLYKSGFIENLLALPGVWREEKKIREEAEALLELVGLADLAKVPAGDLPFGKMRLVELARALATEPVLLLLDEAASGLNTRETLEFMELLNKIKEKFDLTLLIVEHDMDFIMEFCSRLVVLDFGEIIAEGAPEEVRKNPEVIKAYLGE